MHAMFGHLGNRKADNSPSRQRTGWSLILRTALRCQGAGRQERTEVSVRDAEAGAARGKRTTRGSHVLGAHWGTFMSTSRAEGHVPKPQPPAGACQ